MKRETRKLIVYYCAALLIIIGIYNFIMIHDLFQGVLWTVFGIIFIILAYFRI